nr:zinc knuckle CX2CX4HX4C [Tanacetum cinerariifolium]
LQRRLTFENLMLMFLTMPIVILGYLWLRFMRSSYARILIEIDARNDLCDIMVIAVPSVEGSGYTKETIRVEYE